MSNAAGQWLSDSRPRAGSTPRRIGLWDAVSIIVGIVIGAGVYETAPIVFANVSSPLGALGVWALGGALSLIGACCYAELATTYPRSGGDYVYLSRAFGSLVGFLFGWCQLAVILTGSIGMMAYVFADYAAVLGGLDRELTASLAAGAVVLVTALNLGALVVSKSVQNLLTVLKVVGLLSIVIAGVLWGDSAHAVATASRVPSGGSISLAMILVLYTFGGWNDAAFVAAEVRNPARNLPRALLFGTGLITLIYLLVNAAFLSVLGLERASSSRAIAADALSSRLGSFGADAVSILVMVSALGAVNALVFTGARLYKSIGADFSALSVLGRVNARSHAPVGALLCQASITLGLIGLVGTATGRETVDALLAAVGMPGAGWTGHGGFDTLLRCTAPVFWGFFLLTSLSLFVLRRREPARVRPFRVPLYPVLPLIFTATCAYMTYSAVVYAGRLSLLGVLLAALGLPLWSASKRRPARFRPEAAQTPAE
jgi:amino acid transporter